MRKKKNKKVETSKPAMSLILPEVIQAARDAGLTDEQINGFTDVEMLKLMIVQTAPEMAVRFIRPVEQTAPEPKTIVKAPVIADCVHEFTTAVLAGFGPLDYIVEREQEQVIAEIRRRSIYHIQSMKIERCLKPDERGKLVSKVTIHYQR